MALLLTLASLRVSSQSAPPPPPQPSPISQYVGRFLDSSSTADFQGVNRTRRAERTKVAPERDLIYMISGGTFGAYRLSTFAARVSSEPLQTGAHGEKFLPFESSTTPEADGSGWSTPVVDSQSVLTDFDWDDRGLTYLGTTSWGLGILDASLALVHQLEVPAQHVLAFRNGASYYVLVSGDDEIASLYDVTVPIAPVLVPGPERYLNRAVRTTDGFIAILGAGSLNIHSTATLAGGSAAVFHVAYASSGTRMFDTATDGTRVFGLESIFGPPNPQARAYLHFVTRAGSIWQQKSRIPNSSVHARRITNGGGYNVLSNDTATAFHRLDGLWERGLGNDYLTFYSGPHAVNRTVLPLQTTGGNLLLVANHGYGDLFVLESPADLRLQKQFTPDSITRGDSSELTVTVTNGSASPAAQFSFTDTYQDGVVNAAGPNSTTCTGATLTAVAGAGSFTLENGSLPANGSCTVTVTVTNVPESIGSDGVNTIAARAIAPRAVTNLTAANATLTITPLNAVVAQMTFVPQPAIAGEPIRMTITLTNPNDRAVTGLDVVNDYRPNLLNASVVNASNTCGGSFFGPPTFPGFSVTNTSLAAFATCTISLNVVVSAPGRMFNIPRVTSTNAAPSQVVGEINVTAASHGAEIPMLDTRAIAALALLLAAIAAIRLQH